MRITRAEIERRLDMAMKEYTELAGKGYDPANGWAQIPRGDTLITVPGVGQQRREFIAALKYGEIYALERLLEA